MLVDTFDLVEQTVGYPILRDGGVAPVLDHSSSCPRREFARASASFASPEGVDGRICREALAGHASGSHTRHNFAPERTHSRRDLECGRAMIPKMTIWLGAAA